MSGAPLGWRRAYDRRKPTYRGGDVTQQQDSPGLEIPAQAIIDRLRAEVANLNDQRVIADAKIDYLTALVTAQAKALDDAREQQSGGGDTPPAMMVDDDIIGREAEYVPAVDPTVD